MKQLNAVLLMLWGSASGMWITPVNAAAPESPPARVHAPAPESSANIRTGIGAQADRAMQPDRNAMPSASGEAGVSSGASTPPGESQTAGPDDLQHSPSVPGQGAARYSSPKDSR